MANPFPDWLVPMAATLTQDRFTGSEWIFERKFDGIRLIAFKNGSDVRLFSRNRLPLDDSYPGVARAVAALPAYDAILDGEAIGGFERLGTADYYVFDVLRLEGRDLTSLPLDERRAILRGLSLRHPLALVTALDDPKPWERARAEGWEGVIAKRRDSTYEHRRSKSWLKMKCEETHDFVVGGFTDPQGKRVGLGALLVGYFDQEHFCYAGKIGPASTPEVISQTARTSGSARLRAAGATARSRRSFSGGGSEPGERRGASGPRERASRGVRGAKPPRKRLVEQR